MYMRMSLFNPSSSVRTADFHRVEGKPLAASRLRSSPAQFGPQWKARGRKGKDDTDQTLIFIHVGKTGGTYVRKYLPKEMVSVKGHGVSIRPQNKVNGARYVFWVRDPVERWVSGFLSRLRHGCPSHCHKARNDDQEQMIFHRYPTPNDLAEVMTTRQGKQASRSMLHTRKSLTQYLGGNVRAHLDDIFFVGETKHMDRDIVALYEKMDWTLPESFRNRAPVHANPTSISHLSKLSMRGQCALEDYLKDDYEALDVLYEAGLLKSRYERKCDRTKIEDETDLARKNDRQHEPFDHTRSVMSIIGCKYGCERIYEHIARGDLYCSTDECTKRYD